jgi:NSS family neurotransmitter:Na+ symporter
MNDVRTGLPTLEQWGSRHGFILATLGSAVGLGNIWRFSYVAGENGGGVFVLAYVLSVLVIGVPLMLAELAIGRRARRDPVGAFVLLAPRTPWLWVGVMAVGAALLILSYYAVVAGWALKYFVAYVAGYQKLAAYDDAFKAFIADPIEPVAWQFAVMLTAILIVNKGVEHGIEATNRLLMPLLAVVLVIIAVYSLTLDNAGRGLRFLFEPDWSALTRPGVYLAALGQAFFSLGLASGALLTYGAYVAKGHRLPSAAFQIALADTAFALVAGIAIFPAVFAFGLDPAQGPTLAFVTLPELFALMPMGRLVGIAFFFLLVIAAVTSAVSLLEVAVAVVKHHLSWSRTRATWTTGGFVFVFGLPSALGFGLLAEIRIAGQGIMDAIDYAASNWILPLGGIATALFAGWMWRRDEAAAAADLEDSFWGRLWLWILRYLAPVLILAVLLRAIDVV